MQLNPYLFFNGQCEAAFKFYAPLLGGKIIAMMTHAGTPAENQVPPEWREKIIHARMVIGDQVLMGSDAPPGHFQPQQGFSVSLMVDNAEDAERIFPILAENGTVKVVLPASPVARACAIKAPLRMKFTTGRPNPRFAKP